MKLQVNVSGSWRNVVEFSVVDMDKVELASEVLASAGGVKSMRMIDDGIVVAYCDKPDYKWALA